METAKGAIFYSLIVTHVSPNAYILVGTKRICIVVVYKGLSDFWPVRCCGLLKRDNTPGTHHTLNFPNHYINTKFLLR